MSAPALSNEFVQMLRTTAAEVGADIVVGAAGVAAVLRLIAEQLDKATLADRDLLASAGIMIATIGEILRDEALRS